MNKVKVSKHKLLAILTNNRTDHIEMVAKARTGYRKEVIRILKETLEDIKAGEEIDLHFGLHAPMDKTHEYNTAIGMLQMCIDEEVEITSDEYKNYVLDEWGWKHEWLSSNVMYTK